MRYCLITALFLSLLFTGCATIFQSADGTNAKKHMQKAYQHELASDFESAAKEYGVVTKNYSQTSYYENALYKGALASINPQNPNPDYSLALSYMKKYSAFSLYYERRQAVTVYLSLLAKIQKDMNIEKQDHTSIVKQKKVMADLKKNIADLKKELKIYKAKTNELEDKLQKMKDIDVQMHENRRKQRPNG